MRPILILFLFVNVNLVAQQLYFPPINSNEWETIPPSELNWCPEKIDSLINFLDEEQTKSFMILKDGKIVLEEYFGAYTPDSTHTWFSAGKSLMATLVGIAQESGDLDINHKTSDYLGTGWTSLTPIQEDSILIINQLSMTTGLDETFFFCTDPSCLTYHSPVNTRWKYHNGPYTLLRKVIENASGQNFNIFTNQKIENKIGMSGFWLQFGYFNFYYSTARDMARFGILIQNNGSWENETVLGDMNYFNNMINTSQNLNPSYGYLWWLNGKSSYIPAEGTDVVQGSISPHAPEDVFSAAGGQGQYISISPSNSLIMIRQGSSNSTDNAALLLHDQIWERIMDLNCATSTNENFKETEINIFPNPTVNSISVKGDISNLTLELFNSTGKKLKTFNPKSDNFSFDLDDYSEGLYFIFIKNKKGEILDFEKVIKIQG